MIFVSYHVDIDPGDSSMERDTLIQSSSKFSLLKHCIEPRSGGASMRQ